MRLLEVELLRLELALVTPLKTSTGAHDRRPVTIVRVVTEAGEGFGECSALAEPTYTEEYADGAEAVLAAHLLPRLLAGAGETDPAAAMARLSPVRGHAMAKAAVEMALLDAHLKVAGRSLAAHLGATAPSVPAGATVGLGATDAVLAEVAAAVAAGYRRVKLKIAPGADLEPVRAVREAFPELVVSVDANGAYDLSARADLDALSALDRLGLAALEQPGAPGDLRGHARLVDRLETPVMLDESVGSEGLLEVALVLRALAALSVKPARLGGLAAARRVHDRCVEEGVHLAVGGMLETGLGRAAALAVGALPGFDLPGDLGGSERYFSPDLTAPHVVSGGELPVPLGPGLGVAPDEAVLAATVVRRRSFPAP